MTIIEFLEARIAEDEQTANWAIEGGDPSPTIGPTRLLAECEAKQWILALRDTWQREAEALGDIPLLASRVSAADAILRVLALPYADHPDYRQEWRP